MESLLNKKVELLPVPLIEGYVHCKICSGISYLLSNDKNLVKCNCSGGLVKVCRHCNQSHTTRIRLVHSDDHNCLDHGKSYKIKYCPLCGYEFGKEMIK